MTRSDIFEEGTLVGGFLVRGLVREDGMHRVYRAQAADGTEVALKLVSPVVARDPVFRRRFEREATIAARVSHPNIVPIMAQGEHDGIPFLAQPLIGGGGLDARIAREGRLPLEDVIEICLEVASGLDAMHAEGLTHRDLKPQTIWLDEQGHAFITDFGLVKDRDASLLTQPGQALGSFDYISPEQIRGEPVTPATDVYALGCVMYECLSGSPPFGDRKGMRILLAHLHDAPPDLRAVRDDLPDEIAWALAKALEKEPEKRPRAASAYAGMVRAAAAMSRSPGGGR